MASSIDQSFNVGDDATLECSNEGGPDNTYQWQVNGLNITGENSQVLVIPSVQAHNGGMYTCIVSNAAGGDSDSTNLYISPYFITQPVDTQTTNGSSITLMCEAGAFPSPSYQWWRTGGVALRDGINTTTANLVIDAVMLSDLGIITAMHLR